MDSGHYALLDTPMNFELLCRLPPPLKKKVMFLILCPYDQHLGQRVGGLGTVIKNSPEDKNQNCRFLQQCFFIEQGLLRLLWWVIHQIFMKFCNQLAMLCLSNWSQLCLVAVLYYSRSCMVFVCCHSLPINNKKQNKYKVYLSVKV